MAEWRTPVYDRTINDIKSLDRTSAVYQKGALNADDLNRIEDNFKYLLEKLGRDSIFIPHRFRNYTETLMEYIQTGVEDQEYTPADYIESSGTQRIDTGVSYSAENEYVIETECEWLGASGTYMGWNAGGQFGNQDGYWGTSSDYTDAPVDGFAKITVTIPAGTSTKTTLTIEQDGVVNSCTRGHGSLANYATLDYPIFAYTNNSGGFQSYAAARMKYFKIHINGTLVRDYVARIDAAGTACFYDKVEEKYYYNVGTGAFHAVKSVKLPKGYTQLSHIKSSGAQHIDTMIIPDQNTRVVLGFKIDVVPSALASLFGTRTSSSSNQFCFKVTTAGAFRTDFGGNQKTISGVPAVGRHIVDKNKNVTTIDGVSVTNTDSAVSPGKTLILFGQNNNGTINERASIEFEFCQIYSGETLLRDYIPCADTDGRIGLYELVEGAFHDNAGSGTFEAGIEIPYTNMRTDAVYELIETKTTYTDWQEHNLPWLSEINRIRANYNALVRLFLFGFGFPVFKEIDYLHYTEVNDWERVIEVGKEMAEKMEQEYRYCGMEESGGDRLL